MWETPTAENFAKSFTKENSPAETKWIVCAVCKTSCLRADQSSLRLNQNVGHLHPNLLLLLPSLQQTSLYPKSLEQTRSPWRQEFKPITKQPKLKKAELSKNQTNQAILVTIRPSYFGSLHPLTCSSFSPPFPLLLLASEELSSVFHESVHSFNQSHVSCFFVSQSLLTRNSR